MPTSMPETTSGFVLFTQTMLLMLANCEETQTKKSDGRVTTSLIGNRGALFYFWRFVFAEAQALCGTSSG